jgi:hypothetical protein
MYSREKQSKKENDSRETRINYENYQEKRRQANRICRRKK